MPMINEWGLKEELRQFLLTACQTVQDRNRTIFLIYLGLADFEERRTLAGIGTVYGITRERVRQLKDKVQRRVRIYSKKADHRQQIVDIVKTYLPDLPEADNDLTLLPLYWLAEGLIKLLQRPYEVAWMIHTWIDPDCLPKAEFIEALRAQVKTYQRRHQPSQTELTASRYREWVARIQANAQWPEKPYVFPEEHQFTGRPQRPVNSHAESHTGCFYSEKLGRQVEYESRAESIVFKGLERATSVRWYLEQALAIPYVSFDQVSRHYYPDIAVVFETGTCCIIEVKNPFDMVRFSVLQKSLAAIRYAHAKGMGFTLMDYTARTLKDFFAVEIAPYVEDALLTTIADGPASWADIKALKAEYTLDFRQMIKLIITHDLYFELNPLQLSYLPAGYSFMPLLSNSGFGMPAHELESLTFAGSDDLP